MSRLKTKFSELKAQGKAAFIPFIMGGDPDATQSLELLNALPDAGADIIEIGMPFSDPMADGPVIEAAGNRALDAGMTLAGVLQLVTKFREKNQHTPMVLMGYANPPYHMGWENFCAAAAKAGVDGLILVDIPPEEEGEITPHLNQHGIDLIRLVTPTSDAKRREVILKSASGFVYYVTSLGVTGLRSSLPPDLAARIDRVRQLSGLPVMAGFGFSEPAQAAGLAGALDGIIVGSLNQRTIAEQGTRAGPALAKLTAAFAAASHDGRT